MESTLHRQLKQLYCDSDARLEVPLLDYRIDVVNGDRLVEIQHGSLSAIRNKVRRLLNDHEVLVVKPLVVRKKLIKRDRRKGQVTEQRLSPKRGSILDLFEELVYFTKVFPHKNLTLETPLVEIEEWRYPGHGRRRRRRGRDYQVEDQRLVSVQETHRFRTAGDIATLVPANLPTPFDTGQLARMMNVKRWIAQRIAYCLRETGAVKQVGKRGNTLLYRFTSRRRRQTTSVRRVA